MIDGIDGLLASLSILGVGLFGLMFLSGGEYIWTLLCASVSGALLGFLIYNWHPARIFMGNGGSMFIGTFFACACLRFMQMGVIDLSYFQQSMNVEIIMPHTIALSIISIPIFDMLTVFTIRVLNKQSPFKADKRHTHHRLLDIGLRQDITVIVLVLANILIILFAYYIQRTGALKSLIYTMLFCACLMFILLFTHWRFSSHRQKNKDL